MSDPTTETRPRPPEPGHMLAVVVRQLGRVRVTARELEAVRGGRLGMKVNDAGDIVLEYAETGESHRGGLR